MSGHSRTITYKNVAVSLAAAEISHEESYSVIKNFARSHHPLSEKLQKIAIDEMDRIYNACCDIEDKN